ncbi:MAG: response regulator [Candidatus Daviesbacteria bacterium]|nr:response regulator [Candidatus Daviesbacteria bacterium]
MKKRKILICDDDQGILEVIKIMLETKSYQVKVLSNGKSIQKQVASFQPDLILLDIWMPGIDGREITKVLKKSDSSKGIPIIIISALNETKKMAAEIGAQGFLSKPFEMDDLLKTVDKYSSPL